MELDPSSWGAQDDRFDTLYLTGQVVLQAATAVATAIFWVVFVVVWWRFTDLMAFEDPAGERNLLIAVPVVVLVTAGAAIVVAVTTRAAVRGVRTLRTGRDETAAPDPI